jgi:NAD(P)H-dependent flavin oxidoreductase YrpB (nitropropane dioxygenase family)
MNHPMIIQGGMGVSVSNWRLAQAVSRSGQLGVVSGTGLDTVLARRLQGGDPGGHMRRAMAHFPIPGMVGRILDAYFIPGGKSPTAPFKPVPMFTAQPSLKLQALTIVANFVEVFLAKEGHGGVVGINLMEKIQLPNLPSLYGAMLAGVDYVLMGAGIPREIPGALDQLAQHQPVALKLHVENAAADEQYQIRFDPAAIMGDVLPPLQRPTFLAIIASATLALTLAKKSTGRVDGFVIEGPTAGGHNAPPRGAIQFNAKGEPIYGPRDEVDLQKIRELGLPFWLAGSYGEPTRLRQALELGATGIQVGTAFALCQESGLAELLKQALIEAARSGTLDVVTDPNASPTGFPFKLAQLAGTLADPELYDARPRNCDLGYLRTIYKRDDGSLGFRCPAEPVETYVKKGGQIEETVGRKCLCNGLMANVDLPQQRRGGYHELPLVTAGDDLQRLARLIPRDAPGYSAQELITYLTTLPDGTPVLIH